MEFAFIGGGNMGHAMALAAIERQVCSPEQMLIVEPAVALHPNLQQLGVAVANVPDSQLEEAAVLVFAVKPQTAPEAFAQVRPYLRPGSTVLSIMAGITLATLEAGLGTTALVRAMPNTPARIGQGMNVFYPTAAVPATGLERVESLLRACGEILKVADENAIDAATAVSGSGPAYVFFLAEHWVATAQELGFTYSEATLLVQQTLRGATALWCGDTLPVATLREQVTSKGGTTAAALDTFLEAGMDKTVRRGIERAFARAKELAH